MTFQPLQTETFLTLFNAYKAKIEASEGCSKLMLLQDQTSSNIFFTYSEWDNEESLNKYRYSELFKTVWAQTKILFQEKAEAWSLTQFEITN
jgi:quinol monooxygenase YgiN